MNLFAVLRATSAVLVFGIALANVQAEEARVLLEMGRDFPETRLFDACQVKIGPAGFPLLAVAGFSQTGQGDVADLSVYEWSGTEKPVLRWRLLRGGQESSSIRTLRAADLNGDGREELIGLGRIGNEDADSRGELQVLRYEDEQWKVIDCERWQSGRYTHGYGMDIADLDGDQSLEIITGGFFAHGDREQAELRVWKLAGEELTLIGSTSWGSESGHTRINSVRVGDVTGDGRPEIVAAGRSGQIKAGEHLTTQEADQLVVWRFEGTQFIRLVAYESDPGDRSRFRELRLAELDGLPGLELLAVGRQEPAQSSGRGKGGGGGKGTGGGRATTAQSPPVRPLFSLFKLQEGSLKRVSNADFRDSFGEVRDVVTERNKNGSIQALTVTASELKPDRSARLDVWELQGLSLKSKYQRAVDLGDETRARQIVLWGPDGERRVLTVGFVQRGEQILGQILDWGPLGEH
jgi:hypothetical protein